MRRSPAFAAAGLLCAVFAAGCSDHSLPRASASATHDDPPRLTGGPPVESPREDAAVARVNGKPITREQLVKPLIDTYGLNLLLNMIQLELARQNAAKAGLKVTPEDVAREKQFMLKGFFPDAKEEDYQQLLVQLLKQQNITQAQWEILLQTNACLRKMAEPLCAGKITEENIQQAFDLRYGAQVKIRDIQVSNIKEAQEVKKRLAEGQKFEEVAKALSQDTHTASQGGEWPAFAANSTTVSDLIKEQAFGLKPGEVSDPLNTGNAIHVITVEKRIAPVVAKLDAPTHEYLRSALMDKIVQE
jgi:foldase protein PrsA